MTASTVSTASSPETRAEGVSIEELLERARAGDVSACSRLYEETVDGVFRHVSFLTGDTALAEDITQDAYARAFTAMKRFEGRSSFTSWVKGIALNMVRMHWRRAATTERVHEELASLGAATIQANDPDRAHQQDLRMRVLYGVLGTLPEHLREIFILRELEGVSTREVAEQLGITANNVAVRATRARAKIRDELVRLGWMGGGS